MGGKDNVRQRKPNKGGEQQDMKSEPKIKHKPKGKGKKSSNLVVLVGGGVSTSQCLPYLLCIAHAELLRVGACAVAALTAESGAAAHTRPSA